MKLENGNSKEERNHLVDQIKREKDSNEKKELLIENYFKGLPTIAFGQCPICDTVLNKKFDPFGIDGRWWIFSDRYIHETYDHSFCKHFYMLCGAVNFNDQPLPLITPGLKVHPGPEVPYVYLKELKPRGRMAVICQIDMECGYTVYSIAYFSKKPKKYGWFSTDWKNDHEVCYNRNGTDNWKEPVYDWDFNLAYWLEQGKLRWCDPGSGNKVLSTRPVEECPFVDLPGRQEIVSITGRRNIGNMVHRSRGFSRYKDDYKDKNPKGY